MVVNTKDLYITIFIFKDICVFPFLKEPINFLKQNYNNNNALEVIAFIEIKYVRPGAQSMGGSQLEVCYCEVPKYSVKQ